MHCHVWLPHVWSSEMGTLRWVFSSSQPYIAWSFLQSLGEGMSILVWWSTICWYWKRHGIPIFGYAEVFPLPCEKFGVFWFWSFQKLGCLRFFPTHCASGWKKRGDCDWINRGVASSNGKLHHSSTTMWLNMGIIKQYTENISYSYIYIHIIFIHSISIILMSIILMIFPLKVYCQRISCRCRWHDRDAGNKAWRTFGVSLRGWWFRHHKTWEYCASSIHRNMNVYIYNRYGFYMFNFFWT